tara:strand:+ start:16618 stop:17691 length:1074 start_codon:yes stop_codon:yes gene_type:complete
MKNKLLPLMVLMAALGLATIAAYYSIFGISKLFSAQAEAVIVMAAVLEVSKLITAAYLERFWKTIHWIRKTYLVLAMLVLMAITSLGIYGFLVAAYQETAYELQTTEKIVQVQKTKQLRYQQQLGSVIEERDKLNTNISELTKGLSNNVITYIDADGNKITTTSRATRQALESQLKNSTIRRDTLAVKEAAFNDSITAIDLRVLDIESNSEAAAEIGPLKYVAQVTNNTTDKVVNWFILLFIVVFDPLAIMLLISANKALGGHESKPNYKVDAEELEEAEEEWDEDHAMDQVMNSMVDDLEEDDIQAIVEANENPPEPVEKLKQAAKDYGDGVGFSPIADARRGRTKVGSKLWDPKD